MPITYAINAPIIGPICILIRNRLKKKDRPGNVPACHGKLSH